MKNDLDEQGQIICPKCGQEQRGREACARCGLVFAKFTPAMLPPDPPQAAEAWRLLREGPHDTARQENFLRAAIAAGRVDYAARMLRLLEREPDGAEPARSMQRRLLSMAQATLPLDKLKRDGRPDLSRRRFWLWLVAITIVVLLCWVFFQTGK